MDKNRAKLIHLLNGGIDKVKVRGVFFSPEGTTEIEKNIIVDVAELFKIEPKRGDYRVVDGYAEGYLFIGVYDDTAEEVITNREPFIILQEDGRYKAYNGSQEAKEYPYIITQVELNDFIKKGVRT